ncbi:MAG: CDP-alcohol phosphatidyltransferase family protein [Anaerolineales bacterium]|nr:CDP-alcohol phosphatidyltransferase family protein [Anaerolineales bacterium]
MAQPTLTDRARRLTKGLLAPVAARVHHWGVHPDTITLIGTLLAGVGAALIVYGHFWWAALMVLIGLPLDALDGAVARLRDDFPRPFGAFWDSTLDRYADGMMFGAFVLYGYRTRSDLITILALISLIGAFLISYTRARAEGLDLECKVGLFSRMERTLVLLALLVTGWTTLGLWVFAIGNHFTALQRIWFVNSLTKS